MPYCSSCGVEVTPDDAFCSQCGSEVDSATADQSPSEPATQQTGSVEPSNPTPKVSVEGVLGRRIVASLIDLAYPFIIALIFNAVMEFFGISDLAGIEVDSLALLVMVGLALSNYIEKGAKTGQTVGKKLMGIMTISKDGSKANLSAIIVRNIFRPADLVLGYGVGLGFILISPKNQRLGDYFARTTVVRVID